MGYALRIDWPKIKSVFDAGDCIVVMDRRIASVLTSFMHETEWTARFDTGGYDYADWDELQGLLSYADQQLGDPIMISDIIPLIDEIEDLLRLLNSHAQCCGSQDITNGDQFTDEVTDGVGDVPDNIVSAGYASDSSDWAGFDDYKCMIAHLVIDDMEWKLRAILPYIDSTGAIIGGIGTVAAVIASIIATGGLALVFEMLAAVGAAATIWSGIVKIGDSGTEALADAVNDAHQELACAIYFADGTTNALATLNNTIDDLFTDAEALILKNLNLGPVIKSLYAGRYDQQNVAQLLADKGYDLDDFDCTLCTGELPIYNHVLGIRFQVLTGSFTQGTLVAQKPYGFKKGGSGDLQFIGTNGSTSALSNATGLALVTDTFENSTVGYPTDFIGLRFWRVTGTHNVTLRMLQMFDVIEETWRNITGVTIRATNVPAQVSISGSTDLVLSSFTGYVEVECIWSHP